MKAIEFFSGIGAFAYAARDRRIEVVAAFDQSEDANRVYQLNFGEAPSPRNLDSISAADIPPADIWWMSPPCTPYSQRGAQKDDADPRSQSLAQLISLVADKLPGVILVENVVGFIGSKMYEKLISALSLQHYRVESVQLTSTDFGTPMKRPRVFIAAVRPPFQFHLRRPERRSIPLSMFLNADNGSSQLTVPPEELQRYSDGMNIVDPVNPASYAICFTSGYGVSYKASGSFIASGETVRRFAPEEILALLGFGPEYHFPAAMDMRTRWRLAGNSVDVRCIRHLLDSLEGKF